MTESSAESLPAPVTEGIPQGARRIALLATLLTLPGVVLGFSLAGFAMATGVVVGSVIAISNFWLLSRIVVRTTGGENTNAVVLFGRILVKFGLLFVAIGAVVLLLEVDGLGVLLGLSTVIGGIILTSIVDLLG